MTLIDQLVAQPPPIDVDEDGTWRVGGTRVRLNTVIGAFKAGSSPEEILLKFPSLQLADIYAVITYYLWHRREVEQYLDEHGRRSDETRREIEARYSPQGVRERLLARRDSKLTH